MDWSQRRGGRRWRWRSLDVLLKERELMVSTFGTLDRRMLAESEDANWVIRGFDQ